METIETPHGEARAHITAPDGPPRGLLVLGHGAGGGPNAKDLQAAAQAAIAHGLAVALTEQPYRVAGRKAPAPAAQLDVAWLALVAYLRARIGDVPLIAGGRSSGARVACRTAHEARAMAVLCLAFPLHPPGNADKTRLGELDAVTVPVLVVQGESDPFGMPPDGANRTVARLRGNHSLASDIPGLRAAVTGWLAATLPARRAPTAPSAPGRRSSR
jgi:predicted alpha/beta-hydrolase family hydrolase